jgi:ABC-type transport system involved in multi-copper enzyme maturation permease subunit
MPSAPMNSPTSAMLALSVEAQSMGLYAAIAIVVLGLLVYGLRDLLRVSLIRIWAIGSVVFRDSIRKRILWLAPLGMLGVVAVSQFGRSIDEQDAIRQTVKFCLFASGLLVVLASIVLSCTSLPKDIESKVVFTIVTKPISRLEIVLGKMVGLARVTGTLLVIMGLFSYAYLSYRAFTLERAITQQLENPTLDRFTKQWLEHYRDAGLLETRFVRSPDLVQVLARIDDSGLRWMSTQQQIGLDFDVPSERFIPPGIPDAEPGAGGLVMTLDLRWEQTGRVERMPGIRVQDLGGGVDPFSRFGAPEVAVVIFDPFGNVLVGSEQINEGRPIRLPVNRTPAQVTISPQASMLLAQARRFLIQVAPINDNYLIAAPASPLKLTVPALAPRLPVDLLPRVSQSTGLAGFVAGREGRFGPELAGPGEQGTPVGVFSFRNLTVRGDVVPIELRFGVERTGDDSEFGETEAIVTVVNTTTGNVSAPIRVALESNRATFVNVPAAAFEQGSADVRVSLVSMDRSLGALQSSVTVVTSTHTFLFNLTKSLLSQWMLSILVVIIGLFCSTFVSWPIAVVLSVVMLMGRWAVNQLSDSLQPGIGAQIAQSIAADRFETARVVSSAFDGLARMLNLIANFLPDIDAFSTIHRLERMSAVGSEQLLTGLIVLVLFGLPMLTLAYVFLRNKEVAP